MSQTQKGSIPSPQGNLLEIIAHPIVVAVGAGVLAGYITRKSIITTNRQTFGWARKDPASGRVIFVRGDGSDEQVPGAYLNRILLAGAQVLIGTLVIGASQDVTLDLLGAGFAAGGMANVAIAVLNIE